MFPLQQTILGSRKRDREVDDETGSQSFSEHRPKRPHVTNLPLRRSPVFTRQSQPAQRSPSLADITPSGSDCETSPVASVPNNEPRSFFSPWSSPYPSELSNNEQSPGITFSQSSCLSDAPLYSDGISMAALHSALGNNLSNDHNNLLSVGQQQPDTQASSLSGRIPTPIHPRFADHIHSQHIANSTVSSCIPENYSYGNYSIQARQRFPSPISEGDGAASSPSPGSMQYGGSSSTTVDSDSKMDLDVEMEVAPLHAPAIDTPELLRKKGHTRSKYSHQSWDTPGQAADESSTAQSHNHGVLRKGWATGYRSDCHKCRMKVPGHYAHQTFY